MKGSSLLASIIMLLTVHIQVGIGTTELQKEASTADNSSLSSSPYSSFNIEVLRGRDGRDGQNGRDGRDGMRGDQGSPGHPGEAGPQGQSGARGPPGPHGAAGPPGQQGPAGPTGALGQAGPRSGGVTYTRWGKSLCPNVTGTELLYTGRTGGSYYTHTGGGANYLCMPLDPEYTLSYKAGVNGYSYVYGIEYQYPLRGYGDHNVPCAVCYVSTRETVLMIPAKTSCPTSWTREYYGYLMSASYTHQRSFYECIDKHLESLPGSHANTNGAYI